MNKEIEDLKNEIIILQTNFKLLERIKRKAIIDEIREGLMSVHLVYQNGMHGYSHKETLELLENIET